MKLFFLKWLYLIKCMPTLKYTLSYTYRHVVNGKLSLKTYFFCAGLMYCLPIAREKCAGLRYKLSVCKGNYMCKEKSQPQTILITII